MTLLQPRVSTFYGPLAKESVAARPDGTGTAAAFPVAIEPVEVPPIRSVTPSSLADGGAQAIADWTIAIAVLALATLTLSSGYETVVLLATLTAAPLVAWIVAQDIRSFTIPDGAVAALAALALTVRIAAHDPPLAMGFDVLLTGGVLLAFREIYFRCRGFDGLGLGDVKLAAAGGLLVGAQAFSVALLAASLVTLAGVAAFFLASRGSIALVGRKLAFGALLAPAIYLAWFTQALPFLQRP